eukprot:gene4351-5352_t
MSFAFHRISNPCPEPGTELCTDPSPLECSSVPCDTRAALLAGEDQDTVSPVVTLLQETPVRVGYGDAATSASLRACESLAEAKESPAGTCVASAADDVSGDVSSTLTVVQDTTCDGCSSVGCPLGQVHLCFPGTYGYSFEARDEALNRGSMPLQVKVIEEAAVSAKLVVSAGTSDVAEAEAAAAKLLDEESAEAVAFSEGVASLLNGAADPGDEEVLASDIAIVSVLVVDAEGNPVTESDGESLSHEVSFTTGVTVAGAGAEARRRRRRVLADAQREDVLAARTNSVAALLAAAAEDGRMTTSLAESAAANNASMSTEVAGLAENPTSAKLTEEVDELAAYEASIKQTMEQLQAGSSDLTAGIADAHVAVSISGGSPDEWGKRMSDAWLAAEAGGFKNVDELIATANEMMLRYVALSRPPEYTAEDAASSLAEAERVKAEVQAAEQALRGALQMTAVALVREMEIGQRSSEESMITTYSEGSTDTYRSYYFDVALATEWDSSLKSRRQLLAPKGGKLEVQEFLEIETHVNLRVADHGNNFRKYARWSLPSDEEMTELEVAPTTPQKRYVGMRSNRLVGGLLIRARRGGADLENPACTRRFSQLGAPCYPRREAKSYGTDPVFNSGSALYRPELEERMGEFYDVGNGSTMLNEETRHPMPFSPRDLPGEGLSHYFFLDAGLGGYRAQQVYTFLDDGNMFDQQSKEMTASMILWNPSAHVLTQLEVTWSKTGPRLKGGNYETQFALSSIIFPKENQLEFHSFISDATIGLWAMALVFLLWLGVSSYVFVRTFRQFLPEPLRERYGNITYMANLAAHLGSSANLATLVGAAMQMAVVAVFFRIVYWQRNLHLQSEYDVYEDLYTDANYFLPKKARTESADDGGGGLVSAIDETLPSWALPDDNSGIKEYMLHVEDVNTHATLLWALFYLQATRTATMFYRIILTVQHQKRLAVTFNTVQKSVTVLCQQLMAFVVLSAGLAMIYHISTGHMLEQVHTYDDALLTLNMAGLIGSYTRLQAPPGWESSTFDRWRENVYLFASTFFYSFTMVSMIFAIVGDALADSMQEAKDTSTVAQDLRLFYKNRVNRKILRKWPPMERVVEMLKASAAAQSEARNSLKRQSKFNFGDGTALQDGEEAKCNLFAGLFSDA